MRLLVWATMTMMAFGGTAAGTGPMAMMICLRYSTVAWRGRSKINRITPTRGVPAAACLPTASTQLQPQQQQHVPMHPSPFHPLPQGMMMGMGGMGTCI